MKGEKTGGRKRGSLNKRTLEIKAVESELLDAWRSEGGSESVKSILKAAIEKALGYPVEETTTGEDGELIKTVTRREYNFGPIAAILPYIARKMPETLKHDGLSQDMPAKDFLIALADTINARRNPA